jgi:predicted nucleic acid-binding Zn ribbon protein
MFFYWERTCFWKSSEEYSPINDHKVACSSECFCLLMKNTLAKNYFFLVFVSFYFLAALWFELRVLCLLRQMLYHLSHTPALFGFIYFSVGVLSFLPRTVLYYNPPTYASHTAGIRHAHQTWLVC